MNDLSLKNTGNWVQLPEKEFYRTRCPLKKASKHHAIFEVLDLQFSFRTSQVLDGVKILFGETVKYEGRAVVSNVVRDGNAVICEIDLEDLWDFSDHSKNGGIISEVNEGYSAFVETTQEYYRISSECKNVVADLQMGLISLKEWMGKIEALGDIHSDANEDWVITEKLLLDLKNKAGKIVEPLFEKFEVMLKKVPPSLEFSTKAYIKRQLLPLVLGAPFCNRSYRKPLGYAGDFEMVRMMLETSFEGENLYAKVLNSLFLETPPVVAHRLRIDYLVQIMNSESRRAISYSRPFRVFNLGCGPAVEVKRFLEGAELPVNSEFTLVDFSQQTLDYAQSSLESLAKGSSGEIQFKFLKQSVVQLLRESLKKRTSDGKYDLVYCAGLFDYLEDTISKNLIQLFYQLLAPGGLLVVTNVDSSNPSRGWMDFVVDWYLIYRDQASLRRLVPDIIEDDSVDVKTNGKGVNIFLEVRKPNTK